MSEENKNIQNENESEVEGVDDSNATSEAINDKSESSNAYTDTVYFANSAPNGSEPQNERNTINENSADIKTKGKRISVKAFVISLIAITVAAVMLTYSIASSIFKAKLAAAYYDSEQNSFNNGVVSSTGVSELDVIAEIINSSYYGETDPDELMNAAIDAYVKQTGDVFAAYYTKEELEARNEEDLGKMTGVGVNIINSTLTYQGSDVSVLKMLLEVLLLRETELR